MKVDDVVQARALCPEAFAPLDAETGLSEDVFTRLENALTTAVFSGRAVVRTPKPLSMKTDEQRNRELDQARWHAIKRQALGEQR